MTSVTVKKRCGSCGWLASVRVQWRTRGDTAVFPCPACGARLTASVQSAEFRQRYNARVAAELGEHAQTGD